MTVSIAEYLGQRTDLQYPLILPNFNKTYPCPFMNSFCSKLSQGNKPICCVRDGNGKLWIVCRNRLCATKKGVPLSSYQVSVLEAVSKTVFGSKITSSDVGIRREEPMPVSPGITYHADYVMVLKPKVTTTGTQNRIVLEMQGGGETTNTGKITQHVTKWEQSPDHSNEVLRLPVKAAGLLVTNAWRRQQEQFLVKGSIATKTGAGMVFCVGALLYDYLMKKVAQNTLQNLHSFKWDLAIVGFKEDISSTSIPGPIPMLIDSDRLIFVSYLTFVQALIDQGKPSASLFSGTFESLDGNSFSVL